MPLAAAIVLLMAADPALAYVAANQFVVRKIDDTRMEVIPKGGLTYVDGWCAVGDYAIALLGLPPDTPIWLISEPPRRARQTLTFSFSIAGAAQSNGLNQIGNSGQSLTAAAARSFCPESIAYWAW